MNIEKKEKAKKIGLRIWLGISTALSLMFVVFVAIACSNVNSNKQANAESEVVEFHQDNKLNVAYDDENYTITLSADELNNYHFDNLAQYCGGDVTRSFTVNYNHIGYGLDEYDGEDYYFRNSGEDIEILFSVVDSTFKYFNNEVFDIFEYSLDLYIDSSEYDGFKSAIELDIQANQPQPFVSSIFTALTNSISGFIGTLGVGIVAITSIFWVNNALTTIGLLSVIVVAVSIAFWLFRLIIGLIRMRG